VLGLFLVPHIDVQLAASQGDVDVLVRIYAWDFGFDNQRSGIMNRPGFNGGC
jgi:hypothetical protein